MIAGLLRVLHAWVTSLLRLDRSLLLLQGLLSKALLLSWEASHLRLEDL